MITKDKAQALFSELREVLTRLNDIVTEILDTEAWLVLGYESFSAAYEAELAHLPIRNLALRDRLIIELAKDETVDTTPDKPHLIKEGGTHPGWGYHGWGSIGKINKGHIEQARMELAAGVPEEEFSVSKRGGQPPSSERFSGILPDAAKPIHRRSTYASAPSRPTTFHVEFTADEYDRFKRIAEATGRDHKSVARQAIVSAFDRLESGLTLSI